MTFRKAALHEKMFRQKFLDVSAPGFVVDGKETEQGKAN